MYLLLSMFLVFLSGSGIVINDAWIRPGAAGMNSAIYFTIQNNNDLADTLYGVSCNAAKIVELHETYKKGDQMGMRKTDFVVIKGKSSFTFKPGAHHVMLIDLKKKLKSGEKYSCTLMFKKAGQVKAEAVVKK